MSVTGVAPANRAAVLAEIDRLVRSEVLQNSESLCKLLRYLGEHALDSPGTPVKEYQIATEVFGRSRDFDPRLDSTVRVQTGRLRAKLGEYYSGRGQEDPLVVEVPKGSYALQVRYRPSPEPVPVPLPPVETLPPPESAFLKRPSVALLALSAVSLVLGAAVLYLVLARPHAAAAGKTIEEAPAAFRTFWADFIDTPDRPWAVFSNAEFVGRPETGMKYFDPQHDSGDRILDHYTGVGEVIAIHELDRVFTLLDHSIRVKRGRLLSIDDAKSNDIIFIGSPSENLALREIPSTQDFVFRVIREGSRKGDLGVFNARPKQGESTLYVGSKAIPLTEDYAVIGLVPGLNPALRVLVLAGTTTIGTQAAAEFVSRTKDLEDLIARLGGPKDGRVPPFEAVLHVKVNKGVPVQSDIVALHTR